MAANYYASTQSIHWTHTRASLAHQRALLAASAPPTLTAKYPSSTLPDPRHIRIYLHAQLAKLARRNTLRQQCLATAQTYLARFYTLVDIRATNVYLLMTTAIYLACKIEESPHHIRVMLSEAARQWPELGVSEVARIGECEFALISTLRARLVVWHPYRFLGELAGIVGLGAEEQGLAWSVVNDSYCTDLQFLYPPHIIATAAVFLAVVLRPATPAGLHAHSTHAQHASSSTTSSASTPASSSTTAPALPGANPAVHAALASFANLKHAGPKLAKLVDWLADSGVAMEGLVDATQELVSLYQCWEEYNERGVKEALGKFSREGGTGVGK
ncbi:RNA polymerase II holoenzyme cyclin-like subunit [Teratosphaeriaceae sp. CCFEE 6253]|nr:RNA polymerase II holoenzyme cyclin-like subunit [Teratosphaeriaceae sp. CCFEE 6253]